MARPLTLDSFLTAFLKNQELPDCSIVFEPFRAKRPRRAKRANAMLPDAWSPTAAKPLAKNRSVGDLLEALLDLSPEMRSWTQGSQSYVPRLYDDAGVSVRPDTSLGDLRNRPVTREAEGAARVRRVLVKAFQVCDRALEAKEVDRIARAILAERRGE